MFDQKLAIAQQVRQQLNLTERSNDRSIIESARLMATMGDAGLKLHAALEVTHDVFEEAFAGLAAGMESRRRYLSAHRKLLGIAELIGVDIVATGGAGSKRPDDFQKAQANVVEIARAA